MLQIIATSFLILKIKGGMELLLTYVTYDGVDLHMNGDTSLFINPLIEGYLLLENNLAYT